MFETSERYVCTKEAPWSPSKSLLAQHQDAVLVYDGGMEQEYERYECPYCGLRFKVEIPQ